MKRDQEPPGGQGDAVGHVDFQAPGLVTDLHRQPEIGVAPRPGRRGPALDAREGGHEQKQANGHGPALR